MPWRSEIVPDREALGKVAAGEQKARAVSEALNDSLTPSHPASFLRQHRDLTVILDQEAGSLLEKAQNGAI